MAQTIALLSTISEREQEQEQDMVVLSTLHASKGLEWPHVILAGVTEGMLPFKLDDDEGRQQKVADDVAAPPAGGAPPDVRGHHARASARWP
ncbi:UvrD/REP helicase [Alicycliphilus sp. B1]|nr:UvrD/REP helicase [Alicycliphilus sp. B1]